MTAVDVTTNKAFEKHFRFLSRLCALGAEPTRGRSLSQQPEV